MNAGLANLTTLKGHLLPASMLASTEHDTVLQTIGKGVAARLEKYCNRYFARLADDIYQTDALQMHLLLPRAPIEEITSVEQRDSIEDDWRDVTDAIQNHNYTLGLIHFGTILGTSMAQLRVTYTGGYFWETLEPEDEGYPTAAPEESTALPEDLKLAWLMQCQHAWNSRDKHGLSIGDDKPDPASALAVLKLVPEVEAIARQYTRYAIV